MMWPLVVGLGSHFGDDQAGWLILDQLRERGFPDDHLRKLQHPADILDLIDQLQRLVVCDACMGAGPAGTIHCWQWPSDHPIKIQVRGTHDMGLYEVLELASNLGWRPRTVEIWAVEGQAWFPNVATGVEVCTGAAGAADAIWEKYRHA
jgi:hydrogenase maturation protease